MSNETADAVPATLEEALAFAEVLIAADVLDTPADVVYYLRKLHNYSREYAAWTAAGRPGDDDRSWKATLAILGAIADGGPSLAAAP